MSRFFQLLLLASILLASIPTNAQNSSISSNYPIASLLTPDNTDWSYYIDDESKTFYIDFETISVNLRKIVVRNGQGKEIFKDDVTELPVNTIYEIDYSTFRKGNYTIELHSFTGMMSKKITL